MAKATEAEATRVVGFLTKLRSNWGKRFESDQAEDAWLDTMIGELHVFPQDVLDLAAAELLRSKMDFFPRVGQCIDACVRAKRQVDMREPGFFKAEVVRQQQGTFFSLADELLRTQPMAREAARDGWILSLEKFIVRHGRLPDGFQKMKLAEGAREADDLYRDLLAGRMFQKDGLPDWRRREVEAHEQACIRMGTTMMERRQALAKRVLGE